jgi:hypothetical protein
MTRTLVRRRWRYVRGFFFILTTGFSGRFDGADDARGATAYFFFFLPMLFSGDECYMDRTPPLIPVGVY